VLWPATRSASTVPALHLAAALLLLTGCTGGGDDVPIPSADPCLVQDATEVPEECLEDGGEGSPGASPPASSADIAPITQPPVENELARAANDQDPSRTNADFDVTIPAGARLRSTVICNGAGTVRLTTSPESGAQQEFRCEYGGEGVELTVEAATQVAQQQAYEVSFTAEVPARWLVVLSYVQGPPDSDVIDG
jgi:hypothetical protein